MKIPKYAKIKAQKALKKRKELPKSKKFGLNPKEAKKENVFSGVSRARQIVKQKVLSDKDVKAVCRFKRFINCQTPKCKGAIDLWGGKKFIKKACKYSKKI